MKLSVYRKYSVPGGVIVDDIPELEYHASQIEIVDCLARGIRFKLISAENETRNFEISVDRMNYKYIITG